MPELTLIQNFIVAIPPVLLAITLHEVAHGRAALALGDTTAQAHGRLSLNPLRHVDPIGTILVPAVLFFLSGFLFGWAKPVPVNMMRLRQPKRDMALVALAGPLSNLLMAVLWALVLSVGLAIIDSLPWAGVPLFYMGSVGITINVVLAVLNLLPLPPLDGSKVLAGLLPDWLAVRLYQFEKIGLIVLVVLLASGVLWTVLGPPVVLIRTFILEHFIVI